ncbi:MAG: tetratricopeptide repeat protein [Bacteroidia bacterium]
MKKYFLLPLFYLSSLCSFAQQKQIDSLQNVLKTTHIDTSKVIILNNIASRYRDMNKNKEAQNYFTQALLLAQKNNFLRGEMQAYSGIGGVYELFGKYDEALRNYKQGFAIAQKTENVHKMILFYVSIGNVYMESGHYDDGLASYKSGLAASLDVKDTAAAIKCYSNLGETYYEQGNFLNAEKNFLTELKLSESTKNQAGIASAYYTLAAVYYAQGNFPKALSSNISALEMEKQLHNETMVEYVYINIGVAYHAENKDAESLESYQAAIAIAQKLGDKRAEAECYKHIGVLYGGEKKYAESLTNFKLALDITQEIGNKAGVGDAYSEMANVLYSMNKLPEARDTYLKGMVFSKEVNDPITLKNIYFGLAEVYEKQKNYEQAYVNFKLFADLKDTLLNQSNSKQITQMNALYESDKKDKQIQLLNKDGELQTADLKRQKIIIRAVEVGLLLILAFAVLLYSRFRVIRNQKNIIELQKTLVEEKNKDITDSIQYAHRIQQALLVSKNYLDKHLSDYFVLYKPKDIVSGDFYWASHTETNFLIAAGDCTGHGVPGAFMSMLGINFLNEIVIEKKIVQPDKIMNELRQNIIHALNPEDTTETSQDGMDMVLCSFNFKENKLQFAASNTPLWIIRNSTDKMQVQLEEHKPDKFPIGKHDKDKIPFTAHEIQLQKGDIVYTFSDGYADQFGGASGKKFKYKQFQQLLLANCQKPMSEQKEVLNQTIETWRGNLEQVDDVLVIGIKI